MNQKGSVSAYSTLWGLMPKDSDGTIAIVALIALAAWLLIGLPLLYLPDQGHVHGEFLGVKYGEWLIFAATAVLALTTWLLVKGAKKTAERQLRAYVTVQEVSMHTHRGPSTMGGYGYVVEGPIHTYRLAVVLKNGGSTPAINGKINISHRRFTAEIAPDFDFPDSTNFANALIGPQVVWLTPAILIPASDLESPLVGNFHYLWGWIEYDDIFGTTLRRTEFCFRIDRERLQPTNELWVGFTPHSQFNAAS
jgi:hypothetical protein